VATLDIVIVDFRAGELLRTCLRSLAESPPASVRLQRVVVVDNAPGEHSVRGSDGMGLPLEVVVNRDNRGFAAACNQGATRGTADFILFLNPDTRVVPEALDRPVAFMERPEESGTGIVGVQLLDDDSRVARTCYRFPHASHFLNKALGLDRMSPTRFPNGSMSDWDHGETRQVDQVMGAFFLVRRPVFDALGGFDERFFVYFEEVDFSLRARRAGYRTMYLTGAHVFHSGCGTTHRLRTKRLFFSLRSRILYGRKHFGVAPFWMLVLVSAMLEPISRLAACFARLSWQEVSETAQAYGMFWRWLLGRDRTMRSWGGFS